MQGLQPRLGQQSDQPTKEPLDGYFASGKLSSAPDPQARRRRL